MSSVPSFGVLSTFDHLSQEWDCYKSRINQWFIANDLNELTDKGKVKRRAIILSALAEATYKLIRNLALPGKVEDLEYDKIISLFDAHFTPKRCGFAERFHFYSASQQLGESHAQWAARLRGLAAYCDFKDMEGALLDKFVMGMAAGHEKDKLFAQSLQDLTLSKAVELAASVRCARDASSSAGAGAAAALGSEVPVFSITNQKCSVCGYTSHKSDKCRFKNYKCKSCGKKGHLRKMCISKVHFVEEGEVNEGDDGKSMFNIRCVKGRPMSEIVSINGLLLEFEIDSGSAVSVISYKTYSSHFSNFPLSHNSKKLINYTGGSIITVGFMKAQIQYNGRACALDVYVVRGGGPPLLGRDFIREFNLELAPVPAYYCTESNTRVINEIINRFHKLFSGDLGCFNKYKVNLRLKPDSVPIFFKPRSVAFALRNKIDQELDRLLQLGILVPVEHAEYASPIVPALKKDGGVRICADYSVTINKQLIVSKYPLPTVQELFTKLHGGEQFTKLDLSSAYNQFLLSEESQNLTCINTHRGLFKYTRMVFGLSSAPAIFQRAMECVLAGLEGTIAFLDDILVTGSNISEHQQRLMAVLGRLEEAGFTLQKNKCEFFKDEIHYLGHVIDKHGIRKSQDKVKAILEAPVPTNVSQLQSFLGLVNYYRGFVPNASSLLNPLYNLLNKNCKWEWTTTHEQSFQLIKEKLASDEVLAHFHPDATIILTVDASPTGLGAVLSQRYNDSEERPLAYASRTLSVAEKKYSQIQKEATAIIFGVRRFHQYLYGRATPFVLRTDHKPLITIFGPHRGIPEVSANRLQRYAMFLSAYNYEIEYIRSKNNNADFLSRASIELHEKAGGEVGVRGEGEDRAAYVNFVVEGDMPVTMKRLRTETERDHVFLQVKKYVLNGWPRKVTDLQLKPYYLCRLQLAYEQGCLMRGHKVVIPEVLREEVCKELHSSHFGIVKMKAEARKRFWFPGIDAALERLAANCETCAQLRPAPPHAPLAPWPHPPHAFYRIHIDFLGPFNNQTYLIVVDAFSKWVECYNMSTSYNSKAVIDKLCEVMSRFGIPHTLVSDNGTSFTSVEFTQFCNLNGINQIFSPVYHPSSNGQAESFVKIVKKGLRSILLNTSNRKLLQSRLEKFLFDYRNSKNSTTGKSPAELLFGRQLRSRLDLLDPRNVIPSSTNLASTVARNQCSQVKQFKGISRPDFKLNDCVWVKRYLLNKKFTWVKGIIKGKVGLVMYTVYLPEIDTEVSRHIDQIRARSSDERDVVGPHHTWDPDVVSTDGSAAAEEAGETRAASPSPPATPEPAPAPHHHTSPEFSTPTDEPSATVAHPTPLNVRSKRVRNKTIPYRL